MKVNVLVLTEKELEDYFKNIQEGLDIIDEISEQFNILREMEEEKERW